MLKWSLAQLKKYNNKEFEFADDFDFHDYISTIDDILDISIAHVSGSGRNIYDDRYLFNLHIECTLTLECARTLEPVPFPVSLDVEEIYDTVDDGEARLIDKQTIDLYDCVWENIYLEKPMRVFKEGTEEYIDDLNLDDFYNK
ncbi:MAG: YceD family protein [Bacilli bacterium]|nr:YceD family protein [Bacilli bacterium]